MIPESLEETAALYAAGALTAPERSQFELRLEFDHALRTLVDQLLAVTATATLATQRNDLKPSPELKRKILGKLDERVQQTQEHPFVVTGPDRLVHWVNPAFTGMCGYPLEELKGRKLGPTLQGALTDRGAAARMAGAIHREEPCHEEIINYHKDGTPYWVAIDITPIHDQAGHLQWYVAREVEMTDRVIAQV